MAWQRKIPFGYIIRDGLIQPHPQEADAVRYIFGQYLAGASLLTIAEGMTGQDIHYHQHTAEWNKNMVKRILENAKYTGKGGYPQLVADEDFTAAQRQRMERNTYAPLSTDIRHIQNKVVCGLCGTKLVRGNRSHGLVHWKCRNSDCGQSISLSDEALAELVDRRLRELAQTPHLLTVPEFKQDVLDIDTIRLQNELTLALNRGSEKPEYIKALALSVTAQRYRQFPDPTPAYELEQLRVRLEQNPAGADTLTDLLTTAVRTVRLTPDKNVELELVNGKIIAEKEARNT